MKRTLTLADIQAMIAAEVAKATAGYQTQIDYLENKVVELTKANEALQEKIDDLSDCLEDIPDQYDIDRLSDRVDDLESWSEEVPTSRDLEELESRLPTTEDLRNEIDIYFKENIDLGEYISDHLSVNAELSWN